MRPTRAQLMSPRSKTGPNRSRYAILTLDMTLSISVQAGGCQNRWMRPASEPAVVEKRRPQPPPLSTAIRHRYIMYNACKIAPHHLTSACRETSITTAGLAVRCDLLPRSESSATGPTHPSCPPLLSRKDPSWVPQFIMP